MKKSSFILLSAFLIFSIFASAQDKLSGTTDSLSHTHISLGAVEITAASGSNKSVLSQPAAIGKLNAVELNRGNGLFLDDAINTNIPGVTMARRSVSGGQQINIRGYGGGNGSRGANNNFDNEGIKAYLNGIPLTDAEGITLLDDIDFGSIGGVEITKGPAGSLYGLAIAGVVNLKTIAPPAGSVSIGQNVLIGNYGLRRYTTSLAMGGKQASLLVSYGRQTSDGYYDAHAASHKDFVSIAGTMQPNKKERIVYYFGYANSYDQRAGELTIEQFQNQDYSGNPAYIKNDGHSQIISARAGVSHSYNFNSHLSNTTSVFVTGMSSNASSAAGWTDKTPINYGFRSTFDTRYPLRRTGFSLSGLTGLEAHEQSGQVVG
jgi:iron complex outermembrane receptor protein